MSSLNPLALPYIPSQKQGSKHLSEIGEASCFQSKAHSGNEGKNMINSFEHITDNISDRHIIDDIGDHSMDEDSDEAAAIMELDLNFMSSLFPNSSRGSLADIYQANDGDLRGSVKMMNELEDFGVNKDLEHNTQKDESKKEGPDQAYDVTGQNPSSK